MIPRRTVHFLGTSQLVCWGVTHYLIGVFGSHIEDDLGWESAQVYGGYSAALLVMGFASPVVGRLIDRHGGSKIMSIGSVLAAAGCTGLAVSTSLATYYAAWVCLGVAMRCTLYDAAFATLARIGGPTARRAMSQITLLGGLASTAFWPIGHGLTGLVGWRGAVLCYTAIALVTLPLHLALPRGRYGETSDASPHKGPAPSPAEPPEPGTTPPSAAVPEPLARTGRERLIAGSLYAVMMTSVAFLGASMSAHMISILTGLGLAATAAVWVAALRGVAQSVARLADVLFGRRIHPLTLALIATPLLPLGFVAGLGAGELLILAIAFPMLYGAGNGLLTITRGTLPLALFDHHTYGAFVGRLLLPGFMLSASAPIVFAFVIDNLGERGALLVAAFLGTFILAAAAALRIRFQQGPPTT
ncbi:MFS transporter [Phytoactinopolyspora mesophila]|uniref:MFS transporter n=1 Tax=Phytoactinopolyspora mesophila TaxID=2650750 RepID=UPI001C9E4D61|nr:MFS transporter [Phytoactinopolyspora mesophila]